MKPSAMGHRIARDATCIYLNNLPFPRQGKIRGSLAKVPADRHVQLLRSIKFLVLLSLPAADLFVYVPPAMSLLLKACWGNSRQGKSRLPSIDIVM